MRSRVLREIFRTGARGSSENRVHLPFLSGAGRSGQGQNGAEEAFAALMQSGPSLGGIMPGQLNGPVGAAAQAPEIFGQVAKNLDLLRVVTEAQGSIVGANTAALTSNTAQKGASQLLSQAGQAAGGLLGGLTALPLISGIAKLFGFGSSSQPAQQPLQKFSAPSSVAFDAVLNGAAGAQTIQQAGYDQFGNSRLNAMTVPGVPSFSSILATAPASFASSGAGTSSVSSGQVQSGDVASGQTGGIASGLPAQVTVNVQAMDSRSFLDRSHDIAQAVREAMLNMHSINDVVNDL